MKVLESFDHFQQPLLAADLSDLIEKKEAADKKRTGGIIKKLKKEVAQLKKDVGGLKKSSKKTGKKVAKKKKK